MFKKFLKILLAQKKFFPPKKSKAIILDYIFNDEMKFFFKSINPEYIDVRYNKINIYVLLCLLFSGEKKIFRNYVKKYIDVVNPKIIITGNDNLSWFYELKNYFPKIKFIVVQNGFRNQLFFKSINKKKYPKADFIFTFSKSLSKFYKEKIKSNVIPIGSLTNNFYPKKKVKKRQSILFVSSGHPQLYGDIIELHGKIQVNTQKYFYNDIKLFKLVYKFCRKNNLKLELVTKKINDSKEYLFYKKLVNNNKFIYHNRNKGRNEIYRISDEVLLTVTTSSTFGFENLARGNKTAIFNNKAKCTKGAMNIFWNYKISKRGNFWTNYVNESETNRILSSVIKINTKDWNRRNKRLINNLMSYDYKNSKLKSLIHKCA